MLTLEQVRKHAPAVFAEQASPSRSERYTFLSTADVLIPLVRELGWEISAVSQKLARKRQPAFTQHSVRVRPTGLKPAVGDVFPEVALTNSHDGQSTFLIHAALFRLACSNGLVVSQGDFGHTRVLHRGSLDEALNRIEAARLKALSSFGDVDAMLKTRLTADREREFALRAAGLVYDSTDWDTGSLLEARRSTDEGPEVWRVFNRVQENITRGGLSIQHAEGSQRRAKLRGITNINRSLEVNEDLWNLAVEFTH